ncbi:MAG TPA: MmgE/PrpD family protein, partial [Ramlibacter sp.]|nr:MmgE/PrpD family protein [Ramlibacter sp.]
AVGALRRLTAQQLTHAIGIAASMAGGVVANFGSMTKPLHAGRAAEGGIAAAELAQAGLTASPDALDGAAGLLLALAGPGNADCNAPCGADLETTLLRVRPGIKKYPVCYAAHRVVDGVLDLVREHRIAPAEVTAVDATISETTAGVLRQHEPASIDAARFSLEFCVAAALARGRLGIAEVSSAALQDPVVRQLMRGVRTHTVQTSCPLEPSFAYTDRVTVTLRDGTLLDSGPIRFARGHAELPLDEAQLLEKLHGCAQPHERALADGILERIAAALEPGAS